MFRAPAMLLPHESTVAHEQKYGFNGHLTDHTDKASYIEPFESHVSYSMCFQNFGEKKTM